MRRSCVAVSDARAGAADGWDSDPSIIDLAMLSGQYYLNDVVWILGAVLVRC